MWRTWEAMDGWSSKRREACSAVSPESVARIPEVWSRYWVPWPGSAPSKVSRNSSTTCSSMACFMGSPARLGEGGRTGAGTGIIGRRRLDRRVLATLRTGSRAVNRAHER